MKPQEWKRGLLLLVMLPCFFWSLLFPEQGVRDCLLPEAKNEKMDERAIKEAIKESDHWIICFKWLPDF